MLRPSAFLGNTFFASTARQTRTVWTRHVHAAQLPVTEHHSYAEVAKRVPGSCASAFCRHLLSTRSRLRIPPPSGSLLARERESRLCLAIAQSRPPVGTLADRRNRDSPCRRRSDPRLFRGENVADCFKFRNKIGLDVAIEALKDTFVRRRPASTTSTVCEDLPGEQCHSPLHGGAMTREPGKTSAASIRARLLSLGAGDRRRLPEDTWQICD